jgi:hypothetical protein
MPGMPGGLILRNSTLTIDAEDLPHSSWDVVLYLVKHLRPNIAHAVRELYKALDGTSPAAYKELMCMLKYVMDAKHLSLKIKPEKENKENGWSMVTFSNSNYAGDLEIRISDQYCWVYFIPIGCPYHSWTLEEV